MNLTIIEILQILVMILTILIVIGIFYEVHESKKTSRSDFLWRLYEKWDSKELIESRKFVNNLVKKFKNDHEKITQTFLQYFKRLEDQYYITIRLLNYFENLGYLVKSKGALGLKDIDEVVGSSVKRYWQISEGLIMKGRENAPTAYKNFEWLYGKINQMRAEKNTKKSAIR